MRVAQFNTHSPGGCWPIALRLVASNIIVDTRVQFQVAEAECTIDKLTRVLFAVEAAIKYRRKLAVRRWRGFPMVASHQALASIWSSNSVRLLLITFSAASNSASASLMNGASRT